MTPASSVRHLFASQYNRPAAALMVLRELILGRDVFDDAFRHYAKNWTFKRPTPADFFRSIEQSAGMDLSWFWRGWFYSTSHVDLSLESVENIQPVAVAADTQTGAAGENISWEQDITIERNKQAGLGQVVHAHPHLGDVYDAQRATSPEAVPVTEKQVNALQERLDQLTQNGHYYRVVVRNQGGILSPIPLQIIYKDGSSERRVLPVEIWYANNSQAKPLLYTQKEVTSIELDPLGETGDIAPLNNGGPVPPSLSREPVKVYPDSREFL